MTSRDFCFWLQGAIELHGKGALPAEKVEVIAAHLALVFKHEIDPSMGDAAHQAALNEVHKPPTTAGNSQAHASHGFIGGEGPGGALIRC
jgi:hypothetical protein